jgi:hypothetical protein
MQHLDRDEPVKHALARQVHRRERAAAELSDDLVCAPELLVQRVAVGTVRHCAVTSRPARGDDC